jgi:hypothetical protein
MMLYAALTFWLLVIVFAAGGVHRIWSSLIKPRTVNLLLLPGTLAAQLGYVLGVLVSGGTVNNTTVIRDDETAEPQQADNPRPRIPVVGSVLIGMLPLVACAVGLYFASERLGGQIVPPLQQHALAASLPQSLPRFWQLLRDLISLAEQAVDAVRAADMLQIRTALFIYLVICLTVRMAPFPGNLRGSVGAIFLVGLAGAILGTLTPATGDVIARGWPVLGFAVAALLVLLLISLCVLGVVELVRALVARS